MGDWHETLFDDRYLLFYEDALHAGASADEMEFIDAALGVASGSRVIDVGCGFGRHAIPLALQGHLVTGLDASARMLDAARTLANELQAEATWVQRDMRDLRGLGPFDACVCLYTAFGYFSDEENLEVLRGIRDVLVPRGPLLLHLDNALALVPSLPAERWRASASGDRCERHRYDALNGRITSDRVLIRPDGTRVTLPTSSVRLYAPHEVVRLLKDAGFELEQVHGGLCGEPLEWRQTRMGAWLARRR
jgi:SAM-dependent methyltransferase